MRIDEIIDEMETQIDNIKFYSGVRSSGALYSVNEGKQIVKDGWIKLDKLVNHYIICRKNEI
jgi:hypothetical protein